MYRYTINTYIGGGWKTGIDDGRHYFKKIAGELLFCALIYYHFIKQRIQKRYRYVQQWFKIGPRVTYVPFGRVRHQLWKPTFDG